MNKKIAAVAVVFLVGGAVYYRSALQGVLTSLTTPIKDESVASRDIMAETIYAVPNGEDNVRFTLTINKDGQILGAKSLNLEDPTNIHQIEFSSELSTVLQGKNLSDLGPLDKVGKSSLTTAAFNTVLGQLKAQL